MADKFKRLSDRRYQLMKKNSFIQCSDCIDEFNSIDVITPFDDSNIADDENDFDKKFKLSESESDSDSGSECKTDILSRTITQSLAQFIHENGFVKASSLRIRLSGSTSNLSTPRAQDNGSRSSGSIRSSFSDKNSDSEESRSSSPLFNSTTTPLTGRITDITTEDSVLRISIQQD